MTGAVQKSYMKRAFAPLIGLALLLALQPLRGAQPEMIEIWPEKPPGDSQEIGPEKDTSKPGDQLIAGRPVIRLGNVARPTLAVYRPSGKANGTSVLVCPGGGYFILAMDLEGTEICEWLNSIGVTAFLLKYRVPTRTGDTNHVAPLQDAQRAMSLIRRRAPDWQIRSDRVGIIGFSAGGHLAVALSSADERKYSAVDAADGEPSKPDFTMLIYPGGLISKAEPEKLVSTIKVSTNSPPTFLAMAQDDGVKPENVLFYFLALKKAGVPAEVHVYPSGGHGYGLRRSEHFVTTWPDRAREWMSSRGLLDPRKSQ